ncbi:MAG: 2-hydroxyglutaryl-CoA dehydratase [Acholeplasmatales bacterium]|nr:MAG: 2-hydroxyglutaryl-CoA dehydratase [Acholeplasmatales bacterium]
MNELRVGIDIGSTTIKVVVVDETCQVRYRSYTRHLSSVSKSLHTLLDGLKETFAAQPMRFNFTGSAGLSMAKKIGAQFTQEVISATSALRHHVDDVDVCIELGGEDAKIIFFDGANIEQRMNGTCAGGTGAFIDQMASLLDTDAAGLDGLAENYERLYDIASRCGVFAKSDIQPLLNQGARKTDIAASIYQAIVNQTIAGLSQGRKIRGKVAFLGGPLTFSAQLRRRFIEFLNLKDVFIPEHGETFVAYGAALEATAKPLDIETVRAEIAAYRKAFKDTARKMMAPLFEDEESYETFKARHAKATVAEVDPETYHGPAYLGIDAGSTTTKLVLMSSDQAILYSFYQHNRGNPVEVVRHALLAMYDVLHPGIEIRHAFATGYGEALIKNAFRLDGGEVETICHYEAARHFNKDVSFVVDIGGQDMKCFKIEEGVITSVILNEACSSGCGSFIETFAESLGYPIETFADMAVNARHPVDLGSRCTVFMNSSVKQAQSEAAGSKDISAGLAVSVVKNALYKVIRAHDVKEEYGDQIIVQGGTFKNDAVLRAFERETGLEVTRPSIAGLMGAFGAALLAMQADEGGGSTILAGETLSSFTYETRSAVCHQCANLCALTINMFQDGKRYISGNRCEKGAGIKVGFDDIPNLYLYKYDKILSYRSEGETYAETVGIPLVLNMYENLPFWQPFFEALGVRVVLSDRSNKALYEKGQDTIPSDTICYPAKMVHGHIESLYEKDVDFIFYPNIAFNFLEKSYAHNHYNCPIVAHYPEVIEANMDHLDMKRFVQPYLTLNDKKKFIEAAYAMLREHVSAPKSRYGRAFDAGMASYHAFREAVQAEGERALAYAKAERLPVIVLAGRPYHIDPEINHGIPKMIRSMQVVVVSEDALNHLAEQPSVNVLNQWTYHTRLYDVARYVGDKEDINLVQLVSFGCGLDAITADEVKDILEANHKLYTQIKIDEISNLGAVSIRLRSLLSTMRRVDLG